MPKIQHALKNGGGEKWSGRAVRHPKFSSHFSSCTNLGKSLGYLDLSLLEGK